MRPTAGRQAKDRFHPPVLVGRPEEPPRHPRWRDTSRIVVWIPKAEAPEIISPTAPASGYRAHGRLQEAAPSPILLEDTENPREQPAPAAHYPAMGADRSEAGADQRAAISEKDFRMNATWHLLRKQRQITPRPSSGISIRAPIAAGRIPKTPSGRYNWHRVPNTSKSSCPANTRFSPSTLNGSRIRFPVHALPACALDMRRDLAPLLFQDEHPDAAHTAELLQRRGRSAMDSLFEVVAIFGAMNINASPISTAGMISSCRLVCQLKYPSRNPMLTGPRISAPMLPPMA